MARGKLRLQMPLATLTFALKERIEASFEFQAPETRPVRLADLRGLIELAVFLREAIEEGATVIPQMRPKEGGSWEPLEPLDLSRIEKIKGIDDLSLEQLEAFAEIVRLTIALADEAQPSLDPKERITTLVDQRLTLIIYEGLRVIFEGRSSGLSFYMGFRERLEKADLFDVPVDLGSVGVAEILHLSVGAHQVIVPFAARGELRYLGKGGSKPPRDATKAEAPGASGGNPSSVEQTSNSGKVKFIFQELPDEMHGYELKVNHVSRMEAYAFEEEIPDLSDLKTEMIEALRLPDGNVFVLGKQGIRLLRPNL